MRKAQRLVISECASSTPETRDKSSNCRSRTRPLGIGEVARVVQRCAAPSSSVEAECSTHEDSVHTTLRSAAVHHFRGRMHWEMAQQYREEVWASLKLPRKFFIKWRGFGPHHNIQDLPAFRQLFLRTALASAKRAAELAPGSVECSFVLASVLWALATNFEVTSLDLERRTRSANYVQETIQECERISQVVPLDPHTEALLLYGEEHMSDDVVTAVAGRPALLTALCSEAQKLQQAFA